MIALGYYETKQIEQAKKIYKLPISILTWLDYEFSGRKILSSVSATRK